jgi:hypothetical protein
MPASDARLPHSGVFGSETVRSLPNPRDAPPVRCRRLVSDIGRKWTHSVRFFTGVGVSASDLQAYIAQR